MNKLLVDEEVYMRMMERIGERQEIPLTGQTALQLLISLNYIWRTLERIEADNKLANARSYSINGRRPVSLRKDLDALEAAIDGLVLQFSGTEADENG